MMINEERQIGRAKNAVLSFLEQRLSIPKIYIDAYWADQRIDVLAINRDGVGDVHAVLLFASNIPDRPEPAVQYLTDIISPLIKRFQSIPAQFKYVAAVDANLHGMDPLPGVPHPMIDKSFSPDGIGKIGFLAVQFPDGGEPEARFVVKPERFRAKIADLANEYIQQHEADWELRA
jgi:hypothetical protein